MKGWDMGHGTWDMGQAIVEYLFLAVGVVAAAYLMVDAVRDKVTQVAERELDRVDAIRTQ